MFAISSIPISTRPRQRTGFTLVELLVVMGIVALLISILLPALNKARMLARQNQCLNNVREIATAMILYANDNKGVLPGVEMASNPVSPMSLQTRVPAASLAPGYAGGGPVGIGQLLYGNYLTDLRSIYCPGRNTDSEYSYDVNFNADNKNVSGNLNSWNPGQNYVAGNAYGEAGYYAMVSDKPVSGTANPVIMGLWNRLGRAFGDTPIVIEIFGWKSGSPYGYSQANHGAGYNIALLDGSAANYPDTNDILQNNFLIRGSNTVYPPVHVMSSSIDNSNGPWDFTTNTPDRWMYDVKGTGASPPFSTVGAGLGFGVNTRPSGLAWIEVNFLNWDLRRVLDNMPK